jgi:myo-inositol-1(or 4)-monophosphatase
MPPANDLLAIATAAAHAAGAYLRETDPPRDPSGWTAKGRADWATDVDRTAERIIGRIIAEATPGATIIGEELSPEITTQGLVWVVDPLDGTTNFLHGFPAYAVSIAAAVDGVLEAGVVLHVPLDRLSHATRGGGAWEGDTPLQVSRITDPEHALIGTGFPFRDFSTLGTYLDQLGRIAATASGVRRPGSAALDLADVAAGRFDGFWEQRLSAWDIAAGMLLVREAGGLVTDFGGRAIGVEHAPVVAGNPAIHAWLLDALAEPEERRTAAVTRPRGGPTRTCLGDCEGGQLGPVPMPALAHFKHQARGRAIVLMLAPSRRQAIPILGLDAPREAARGDGDGLVQREYLRPVLRLPFVELLPVGLTHMRRRIGPHDDPRQRPIHSPFP